MNRRLVFLLFAAATPVLADGGAVILHKRTQALTVTAFASPAPPRAGPLDVSVLVQSSDTLEPVLDAQVWLRFAKPGSQTEEVQATRTQAKNKLLYAASTQLADPGDWQLSIETRTRAGATPVTVSGSLTVAPEQRNLDAYSAYIALPFLALIILALHQWLRLRPDDRYPKSARLNPELGA
ncbi:MAG TPA: FixH family protein [Bryobacteraceae bacterium]|nr:FixH family protein [Bryobacteraceae bacterium]